LGSSGNRKNFKKKYMVSVYLRIVEIPICVQFINEQFFRQARPHKGLWRGVLDVRRSRKAAENAARQKNGYLWKSNSFPFALTDINRLIICA
jgi:hypothetical protein